MAAEIGKANTSRNERSKIIAFERKFTTEQKYFNCNTGKTVPTILLFNRKFSTNFHEITYTSNTDTTHSYTPSTEPHKSSTEMIWNYVERKCCKASKTHENFTFFLARLHERRRWGEESPVRARISFLTNQHFSVAFDVKVRKKIRVKCKCVFCKCNFRLMEICQLCWWLYLFYLLIRFSLSTFNRCEWFSYYILILRSSTWLKSVTFTFVFDCEKPRAV